MDTPQNQETQKYFLKFWLAKLNTIDCLNFPARLEVYETALEYIPGSYKMWKLMFDEFTIYLKEKCILNKEFAKLEKLLKKSLEFMKRMPRIWLIYAKFLENKGQVFELYNILGTILTALPATQHDRIWKFFVPWAEGLSNVDVAIKVLKRYLKFEPSYVENFVALLEKRGQFGLCAEYIFEIIFQDNFYSEKGMSAYEYSMKLCSILATKRNNFSQEKAETVFRMCLGKYSDEIGNVWVYYAEFYIRQGKFKQAREVFKEALEVVLTNRDFGIVYDAFLKLEEEILNFVFDETVFNEKDANCARMISEIKEGNSSIQEEQISRVENLLKNREWFLNSTKLRQNRNKVSNWLERFELTKDDDTQLNQVFLEAIKTIEPLKAEGLASKIWMYMAAHFENKKNFKTMNQIFLQGLERNFKFKSEYTRLFKGWMESLLKNGFAEDVMTIIKSFLFEYGNTSEHFSRILKAKSLVSNSNEIWSLYLDLEFSLGKETDLLKAYKIMMAKKLASPINVFNYLKLLQKKDDFEEIIKVCENAIELFKWPALHFMWLFYIHTFETYYAQEKRERVRDLYKRVLKECPKDKGGLISNGVQFNVGRVRGEKRTV